MLLLWSSMWEVDAWLHCREVEVVLATWPGWLGIVQSYLQTTLALLFIVSMSRLLFLPAVTSEKRESNRNSALKLVCSKPFKMLMGAIRLNVTLVPVSVKIPSTSSLVCLFNKNSLTLCSQSIYFILLCLQNIVVNIVINYFIISVSNNVPFWLF